METFAALDVDWLIAQVYGFFLWLWSFWEVKFLLAHIGLNVLVAIAASIYTGEFLLGRLGEFLYKKVLPYLLVFAGFAALGAAAELDALATVAFAGLEAMLLGDLFDNLKKMGIKIPDVLTKPSDSPEA